MIWIQRRDFINLLGGAVAAWPLAARAQQATMPVVGFVSGRSLASDSDLVAVFLRALNEAGYVNGQNVAIEFRWEDGQLDRFPECGCALRGRPRYRGWRLEGHSRDGAVRLRHRQGTGCCRSRCQP